MKHLGVHIDVFKTRAVLFDLNKDNGKIVATDEFDVPEGMIVDGEIANIPQLTNHLKAIRKRFGRVNTTIALPSKSSVCTVIRIPDMPAEEIRQALGYEMEKHIKKGVLSDYIWNYVVINEEFVEIDRQRIKNIGVLAVAFPKMHIVNLLECAKKAGLHVVSVEAQDVALWRSYAAQSELNYVNMHIGHNEVQFSTFHRGNLYYVRPKANIGTGFIFKDEMDTMDAMNTTLVEELRKTSEYYADRTKTRVEKVFVTSFYNIPDTFVQSLATQIANRVQKWEVRNEFVLNNKRITYDEGSVHLDETYAVAFGLALRSADVADNVIDLIPKDYVRKNRISQVVKICLGTGAVLLVLSGSFVLYVRLLENKLSNLLNERNEIQAELDWAAQIQTQIENLRLQIEMFEKGTFIDPGKDQSYSIAMGNFMHYIEKNIPRDVKIHNMHYESASNSVILRIIADSQQSIGSFLLLLEKLDEVDYATTKQVREYKFGNIVYLASEIEVKLVEGGAAR